MVLLRLNTILLSSPTAQEPYLRLSMEVLDSPDTAFRSCDSGVVVKKYRTDRSYIQIWFILLGFKGMKTVHAL